MILSFKTKHNAKYTNFLEKIWHGFVINEFDKLPEFDDYYVECEKNDHFYLPFWPTAKFHTIREDKHNLWKPGMLIDFFVNARRKNMFRFAPRIPVVSVQKIQIVHRKPDPADVHKISVFIDDKMFYYQYSGNIPEAFDNRPKMLQLAKNDGFDSIEDFFSWFNKDFTGKIIHWTDLQY